MKVKIARAYEENRGVYGARKMWQQMRQSGPEGGALHGEAADVELGLQGVVRGKKRFTTISGGRQPRAADLVKREFHAASPDRLWLADFTYVASWSGTVNVSFVIDAFQPEDRGLEGVDEHADGVGAGH